MHRLRRKKNMHIFIVRLRTIQIPVVYLKLHKFAFQQNECVNFIKYTCFVWIQFVNGVCLHRLYYKLNEYDGVINTWNIKIVLW